MNSVAVNSARGPTILLASGNSFDLLDPWDSIFTINDIALGLSQCVRFAGQCNRFYSVAEHSVLVSHLVAPEHAFAGLMHDAAEAFLGDVTKPLKRLLPEYQAIERNVEAAIFERFAVQMDAALHSVKHADMRALAAEQLQLMPPHDDDWAFLAGIEVPIVPVLGLNCVQAEAAFLARYGELSNCFTARFAEPSK